MTKNRKPDSGWQPCQPGTIKNASKCAFNKRRREFFRKCASGLVVTATGFFSVSYLMREPKEVPATLTPEPVSVRYISCAEVIRLMDDFAQNRVEDEATRAGIQRHLSKCRYCANRFEVAKANV